ncbi:MAG: hypothetical protein M1348_02580 [Candidatus Parvarchaeota archaeon]|jgi:ribosomal protein S3AE|nr:hypothetical protein [Candidatus Parvarchaeota archaeon]
MNEDKIWFKVVVPHFDNLSVGEIFGTETNVVGRKITYSASELRELKPKMGYKLVFKIASASNSECKADLDSLFLSREPLSRLVRHNISKMDIVVPIEIEKKPYAIKVLCTINKTENKYKKAVRAEIKKFVEDETKDAKLKDIFIDAMTNKMQNKLHKILDKVYPTRVAEIRAIEPRK